MTNPLAPVPAIVRRCWPVAALALCLASTVARAQGPAASAPPSGADRGATVAGVVRDSLAHAPLGGATVQLVSLDDPAAAARSATSDSLGRWAVAGVPTGRYTLGFFHPLLDSLGVEAQTRAVTVSERDATRGETVHADVATPSPAQLRAAICAAAPEGDSSAVIVGVVRNARDGAPADGARVSARWLEMTFSAKGIERRTPTMTATTGDNGWFALCNVPRGGTIAVVAARGADSTDVLEVRVPGEGFLRQELYLGEGRTETVAAAPDAPRASSTVKPAPVTQAASAASAASAAPRTVRTGNGRLTGTVVTAAGGQPLAGATIAIAGGPQTRADERGAWTLSGVPTGTRSLEVRAVGYYPERRAVDVVGGVPPLRVALATLQSVLDTVRVSARVDPSLGGFDDRRRRSGGGRFLTADDVKRYAPVTISDVFRKVPGVYVEGHGVGNDSIMVRGAFTDMTGKTDGRCQANLYVDGMYFPGLTGGELDTWLRPERIRGIEVYAGTYVPAQFQPPLSGCGSIVVWTK